MARAGRRSGKLPRGSRVKVDGQLLAALVSWQIKNPRLVRNSAHQVDRAGGNGEGRDIGKAKRTPADAGVRFARESEPTAFSGSQMQPGTPWRPQPVAEKASPY